MQLTYLFDNVGIPADHRHMNGSGVHSFSLINAAGDITFVKFRANLLCTPDFRFGWLNINIFLALELILAVQQGLQALFQHQQLIEHLLDGHVRMNPAG